MAQYAAQGQTASTHDMVHPSDLKSIGNAQVVRRPISDAQPDSDLDEGMDFVPESISFDEELIDFLVVFDNPFTPSLSTKFQQDIATLLQLWARLLEPERRHSAWTANTNALQHSGVTTYGYIFTDQHAAATDPATAGCNMLPYAYGGPTLTVSDLGVGVLAMSMTDYWLSFAVSVTPNDSEGLPSG
ncbi:hypothetical protein DICSQDRAFT_171282 [Dichomitus squalens LYAD-421 SS1]|uniref:Uncharacterized protein n=2 Tax=Dichomitus squalens TaxID=114155 RepID=A0A4Q9MQA6_9APHY|nr:uncharacterized protein DICSQDRAFT_171282 [Dichomitus squalens LYAD-421 SS1]EJF60325.1 hypothetical protein DICSQDRAFT_171282 [Dichomitus squalens LYAD-421 SS1]TBU28326.1 hypothetical protein BD311DRAFT_663591 [Dichomitus squalens]